jgi:hypothetical protein
MDGAFVVGVLICFTIFVLILPWFSVIFWKYYDWVSDLLNR